MLEGEVGPQSIRLAGGSQSVRSSEEAGNDRGARVRVRVESETGRPSALPLPSLRWRGEGRGEVRVDPLKTDG